MQVLNGTKPGVQRYECLCPLLAHATPSQKLYGNLSQFDKKVIVWLKVCRCKIKFWHPPPPPPIENRPGVNIQWIFRWIVTLLSCWILITLLNIDTIFLSRNSTGRRYVDGSEFNVDLWPGVKIPRWIMTPGHKSTLNCDPEPRSQFNV